MASVVAAQLFTYIDAVDHSLDVDDFGCIVDALKLQLGLYMTMRVFLTYVVELADFLVSHIVLIKRIFF